MHPTTPHRSAAVQEARPRQALAGPLGRQPGQRPGRLFERKPDAERYDANVRADLSRGQYIDDRDGQIAVSALAERRRTDQLHIDSTAIRVEHAIRLHIMPRLGQTQVHRHPAPRHRPGNAGDPVA